MNTAQQLEDLVRWLGSQRAVAAFMGKQQRQIWSWLTAEHKLRTTTRAAIAEAWERVHRVVEQVGEDSASIARVFVGPARARATVYALPAVVAIAEEEVEVEQEAAGDQTGYFVPIEDYGARHSAGALARERPLFVYP